MDPFAGGALRCARSERQSPLVMTTTVIARNGAGQETATGPIIITWAGRPPQ